MFPRHFMPISVSFDLLTSAIVLLAFIIHNVITPLLVYEITLLFLPVIRKMADFGKEKG